MGIHKARLTYEDVVATLPHLRPEEQLNVLRVLSNVLKQAITPRTANSHNLSELEGLGAEIWNKVTVEEYLQRERDSWN